jgi:transcriptional regulator with XRE-family HTH domain
MQQDNAIKYSTITGRQIKAARSLLDWTIRDLAHKSGVSFATIQRVENAEVTPSRDTLTSLGIWLEKGGIEFLSDSGVRLK